MKRQAVTVYDKDDNQFEYTVDFNYHMATYDEPEDYVVLAVYDSEMIEIGEGHEHYQDAIDAVDRFQADEYVDY